MLYFLSSFFPSSLFIVSMVSGRRSGGDNVAETSLETVPSTPVGSVEPSLPPLVDNAAAGIYCMVFL